jgi:Ser/Thr protein kinase RdoA (MazF antagonist)
VSLCDRICGVAGALIDVAREALAEYELPDFEIRPVRLTNNAVFEVLTRHGSAGQSGAAEAQYALRVHREGYRTFAEIRSELSFLAALAEEVRGTRIEVPRPVAARSGELVVTVAGADENDAIGSRCCDLLTWVDGTVLKYGTGLGLAACTLLGEGLARVHRLAEHFEPPPGFELPCWDAATMFSPASPFQPGPMEAFLSPQAWALFQEVAARTQEVLARLDAIPGQLGITHNDYILINALFRRSARGWRLGILDFDDLGWGYFLYDLAPILGNLFDYPDAYRRLRRAFLDGYRSIRPLPRELEAYLPVLMGARHAVTLTWLAAKHRRGETDLPIERHVAIRVSEMDRCLTLA